MERTLRMMFEYQRFENNVRLSALLKETMNRYGFCGEGKLSDDDAELLNAAGLRIADPKHKMETLS